MGDQQPSTYQITFEWNDNDYYQDGVTKISRLPTPEVLAEKSEAAMRAALSTIQDIAERIATTMDRIKIPPDEVTLSFGIRLGEETGVITKGGEDAHFNVKLVWNDLPDDNEKP